MNPVSERPAGLDPFSGLPLPPATFRNVEQCVRGASDYFRTANCYPSPTNPDEVQTSSRRDLHFKGVQPWSTIPAGARSSRDSAASPLGSAALAQRGGAVHE